MNNILIGIISYLPDDKEVREHRFNILKWLVHVCNYLFGLPIYIVVQNYDEEEENILKKCKNVTLSTNYEKLGILKARRVLRDYFINSAYTNLIMLDDDCVIVGTIAQAKNYLKQIYDNRDCFIEFNDTLLKLFCISKEIFKGIIGRILTFTIHILILTFQFLYIAFCITNRNFQYNILHHL